MTLLRSLKEDYNMTESKHKSKIISHKDTTMCYCPDCGAATRMGRHLDIDCETIKHLRAQLANLQKDVAETVSEVVSSITKGPAPDDIETLIARLSEIRLAEYIHLEHEVAIQRAVVVIRDLQSRLNYNIEKRLALHDDLLKTQSQLDAARLDSAHLDKMEKYILSQTFGCQMVPTTNDDGRLYIFNVLDGNSYNSLRSAITALKGEK